MGHYLRTHHIHHYQYPSNFHWQNHSHPHLLALEKQYCRHDPHQPGCTDNLRFLSRLLGEEIPGPAPRYDNQVRTEMLDESDGAEFDRYWKATEGVRYVVQ